MGRKRFLIPKRWQCDTRFQIAVESETILHNYDMIFSIFERYSDESYGESPRRLLLNITKNNETLFDSRISCVNLSSGTSKEERSSQEPSIVANVASRKLSFSDDKQKDASDTTIAIASCSQESARSSGEIEENVQRERNETNKEDMRSLLRRNLARIKSFSIVQSGESIGVKIDVDLMTGPDRSLTTTLAEDSENFETTKRPIRECRKRKSPSKKSPGTSSATSESHLTVDYSDPNILGFLSKRLLSILECRKEYMWNIWEYFKKFYQDLGYCIKYVELIEGLIKLFWTRIESLYSRDVVNSLESIKKIANKMLDIAKGMQNNIKQDLDIWFVCNHEIENFEDKHAIYLKREVLKLKELQDRESNMREICRNADGAVLLKDGWREVFLKTATDYDLLTKNYLKFLIITGILEPTVDANNA